jgi:putative ABC transport system permease protein
MIETVRYTLRSMRRTPGFAFGAIATLALGIGATVAIFSVVNAVLFRPLGLPDASRLTEITPVDRHTGANNTQLSFPDFRDLRASNQTFVGMAAFRYWLFNLSGGDQPEGVVGIYAGDSLFQVLGVRPILGRLFTPGVERRGAPPEAILSYDLWQRRFNGRRDVVGATATIDGVPVTVVGVLPASFTFPDVLGSEIPLPRRTPDLFMPVGDELYYDLDRRGNDNYWVLARSAAGASLAAVNSDLERVAATLRRDYPGPDADLGLRAEPLKERVVGDVSRPMQVLFGAVVLVLLIACANVGGLLLARGAMRDHEFGIRTALGASRMRLAGQVLTESLVLALLGGGAGILVAIWGAHLLANAAPNNIARIGDVSIDGTVLAFALVVTVGSGLLFGLAPMLQQHDGGIATRLRAGDRSQAGRVSRRLRSALVGGEIALAVMLTSGAGLLLRSFISLSDVPPGFTAHHVMTMFTLLPGSRYPDDASRRAFDRQALAALDAVPGVERAASINTLPFSNLGNSTSIDVVGAPPMPPGQSRVVDNRSVAGPYFSLMGIPIVAGRDFTAGDTAGAPQVAIINQTAAKRYFAGTDPIGKQIIIYSNGDPRPWTIVGISGDVHGMALDSASRPQVSYPEVQRPDPVISLAIQTRGDPRPLAAAMHRALATVDPDQAFYADRTMDDLIAASLAARRFALRLLEAFAVLAVVLAGVGLYSVIAFSVAQRVREIGVRSALGADRRRIATMITTEGLRLAVIGLAAGLVGALLASGLLRSMLYHVGTVDPVTLAGTLVAVLAVVLLASYLPARRAAAIDPMEALRDGG